MWRDLTGGLRVAGRAVTGEVRAVLTEFDEPEGEKPGRARRAWHLCRRAPLLVQALVGLALLGLWAWLVLAVYQ